MERLRKFFRETNTLDIISIIVSIIVAISMTVYLFIDTDTTPATKDDYAPLRYEAHDLELNPYLILYKDGEFEVKEGRLKATFSNDECRIIAEYKINNSTSLNLLSIEEEDLCKVWYGVLLVSIICGTLIGIFSGFIIQLFIKAIIQIINKTKKIIRKIKT